MGNDYTDALWKIEYHLARKEHKRLLDKVRFFSDRLAMHIRKREQLRAIHADLYAINTRIQSVTEQLSKYKDKCEQILDYQREISVRNPDNIERAAAHKIIMAAYHRAYKHNAH